MCSADVVEKRRGRPASLGTSAWHMAATHQFLRVRYFCIMRSAIIKIDCSLKRTTAALGRYNTTLHGTIEGDGTMTVAYATASV